MWYLQPPGSLPFLSCPSDGHSLLLPRVGTDRYFFCVPLGTVWGRESYWASWLLLVWHHFHSYWGLCHGLFLSLPLLAFNLSCNCSCFVKRKHSAHVVGCRLPISIQSELFQRFLITYVYLEDLFWFSSIAIDLLEIMCFESHVGVWSGNRRQVGVLSSLWWSSCYKCIVGTLLPCTLLHKNTVGTPWGSGEQKKLIRIYILKILTFPIDE